jgi:hypothetical protein
VWRTARAEYRRGRDLIVAWLHETDALAHVKSNPAEVEKSLIAFDRFLAQFEKEIDDDTTLGLISDHGMEKTDARPFSIRTALQKLGIKGKSFRYFLDGGGFAQIYFQSQALDAIATDPKQISAAGYKSTHTRNQNAYAQRLDESHLGKLPDQLLHYKEIDLILTRRANPKAPGGFEAVIRSRRGQASITRANNHYHYRVEKNQDPLDLVKNDHDQKDFALGQDVATCLRTSGASNYPDGHYQVYELLAAPDSGDVILTSAPNKGFNQLTRFGVHGGLNRAQAVTFMLFNRPMRGLEQQCLRSADLPRVVRTNLH